MQTWNDIFLEIDNVHGESRRGLLNSKGFNFYHTSEDVVEDRDYQRTDDLFTVLSPVSEPAPPVLLATLAQILDPKNPDRYRFLEQDNRAEI